LNEIGRDQINLINIAVPQSPNDGDEDMSTIFAGLLAKLSL
jgi:hypothetical protein